MSGGKAFADFDEVAAFLRTASVDERAEVFFMGSAEVRRVTDALSELGTPLARVAGQLISDFAADKYLLERER